jgi:hypothetical protein
VKAAEPFPWDLAKRRAEAEAKSTWTCGLIAIMGLGLLAIVIAWLTA